MLIVDDTRAGAETDGLEIVNPIGRRRITWAIHDIDGTHSLIRDWQPVMSRVLYEVIVGGLPPGYDDQSRVEKLSQRVGSEELPETDRFCVESAGLNETPSWKQKMDAKKNSVKACSAKCNL